MKPYKRASGFKVDIKELTQVVLDLHKTHPQATAEYRKIPYGGYFLQGRNDEDHDLYELKSWLIDYAKDLYGVEKHLKEKIIRIRVRNLRNYCVPLKVATQYPVITQMFDYLKDTTTWGARMFWSNGNKFIGKWHIDIIPGVPEETWNFHVPVTTNAGCIMQWKIDGKIETLHMPADGTGWWTRIDIPHRIANLGGTERIHLIVQCVGAPNV